MRMGIDSLLSSILPKSRVAPKSVEQLMLPMTISGWIVGMGIIEFPLGKRWHVTSLIYALFLIIGYSFLARTAMINIDMLAKNSTGPGKIVIRALFYGNVGLNICGTVLGWLRMRSVKSIINRLEASDEKIEKIGIPRDYRIIYFRQLIALLIQFIFIFIFTFVSCYWSQIDETTTWNKVASAVAMNYPVILMSVGDMSFVTLVRFITLRFNQLNKYLLKMSTTTVDSPQHKRVLEYTRWKCSGNDRVFEKRTNDDANAMRSAREYHHELTTISHMINDTFGIQALLSMTVSFALITGLLYHTCVTIMWPLSSEQLIVEELSYAFFWLAFYILRIVLVNSTCAKASDMAKKTSEIICHLHEPSTSKAYRDEIRDFTLQLTQHSVQFTACGFFVLNYRFIQGMIGSITTYLVILVQIGDIDTSQKSIPYTTPKLSEEELLELKIV